MSSLLQCSLCLNSTSNTTDAEEMKRQDSYLDLILQKLFNISWNDAQITQICVECNRSLLECYLFYEKVAKAKPDFLKEEHSNFINIKNIKTEDSIVDVYSKEDDFIDDESPFVMKKEELDDAFSDEDDIVLNQFLTKLESPETSTHSVERKKHKKSKNTKKLVNKVKKSKVKKKDGEESDPNELIDSNGIFIVKGKKLEALLSKFFILNCDICDMKHVSMLKLFDHYENQHNVKGYVTCCGQKLDIYRKIKFHMAMHVQPAAFNCSVCDKSVTRPAALKYHMLTHLPMAQKPIQCDECGKGFVHRYHLQKHKLLHLPMDQRPFFQCKLCDRTFTVQNTYSAHMSIMHTPPKHLCMHCGKSFRDKMQFNNHMKRHDPDSIRSNERVKCESCGVVLAHKLGLQQHMRRHESNFPCPHCDYVTRRKVELKKHIQVRHTDDKPYVCVVCNKAFKLKYTMKVHMAQHTGERKYTCSFCPRTFLDPGNCYSHKKKMHPAELKNESEIRKLHPRYMSLHTVIKDDDIMETSENNMRAVEDISHDNISVMESNNIAIDGQQS